MKISHVHLKVKNLSESVVFYQNLLGLNVTEKIDNSFVFLSFGDAHHDLALQKSNAQPEPGALYHTAFEVNNNLELLSIINNIEHLKIPYSAIDHGISWAVYTRDPEGNGIEIFLDRRKALSGKSYWKGISNPLSKSKIELNE